jgi:hypothetical protein
MSHIKQQAEIFSTEWKLAIIIKSQRCRSSVRIAGKKIFVLHEPHILKAGIYGVLEFAVCSSRQQGLEVFYARGLWQAISVEAYEALLPWNCSLSLPR